MENQKAKIRGRKVRPIGIRCTEWTVDDPVSVKIRNGPIPIQLQSHSLTDSRPFRCVVLQFKNGSVVSIKQTDLRKELLLC
ncbi:MAG: hypothetical protein JWQ71_468 [Pedosphaera sp.]|nr:hypothetical protein [Pedosphaera sp.]